MDGSVEIAVKYQDGPDAVFKVPWGVRATRPMAFARNIWGAAASGALPFEREDQAF
jgi:hypothetical protein